MSLSGRVLQANDDSAPVITVHEVVGRLYADDQAPPGRKRGYAVALNEGGIGNHAQATINSSAAAGPSSTPAAALQVSPVGQNRHIHPFSETPASGAR